MRGRKAGSNFLVHTAGKPAGERVLV